MTIRKVRRGRIVRLRRVYRRRRRIHRPIGSGGNAKRFFELKTVANITTSAAIWHRSTHCTHAHENS
jgi:hypothetical protein